MDDWHDWNRRRCGQLGCIQDGVWKYTWERLEEKVIIVRCEEHRLLSYEGWTIERLDGSPVGVEIDLAK